MRAQTIIMNWWSPQMCCIIIIFPSLQLTFFIRFGFLILYCISHLGNQFKGWACWECLMNIHTGKYCHKDVIWHPLIVQSHAENMALAHFRCYMHDDVSTWKWFPHGWPLLRGIHLLGVSACPLLLSWTSYWINCEVVIYLGCHGGYVMSL